MPPAGVAGGTYTFTSSPRSIDASRARYKQQAGDPLMGMGVGAVPAAATTGGGTNIMFDKRVRRGASLSAKPNALQGTTTSTMGVGMSTAPMSRKKKLGLTASTVPQQADGPEPVLGRKHMTVQTDEYLEEITDRVKVEDTETQTDPFVDRPPTPIFVPEKTGLDAGTQVEQNDLHLIFDFDHEVDPILEVLVGKTLEQAQMEVLEEEELANLRQHQVEFEHKRNKELAQVQQLEEAERRRAEEKERRLAQDRERVLMERKRHAETETRVQAKAYLADLSKFVFCNLRKEGYFYDHVQREVETQFMPWLSSCVGDQLAKAALARKLVEALVQHTLERAAEKHRAYAAALHKQEEEEQAAAAAAVAAAAAAAAVAATQDAEAAGDDDGGAEDDAQE
eukprot:TRINITY_DN8247_c0_g1_i1.p1 TRINITY_DN8247_c0_g1~~TRINITY_DN8247_c0_g1_i1.p1  ORF type:complete len:424 (-),score=142.48 TRINITY_DN8247_c0_g1_i1:78-1262(-)